MSILIVREDGVIRVDGAVPVATTFLETVEHLFRTLDVRPRLDAEQQRQEPDEPDGSD